MGYVHNMKGVQFSDEDEEVNGYDLVSETLDDEQEVVVELGLTRRQVKNLKWVCECWLKQYEKDEGSPMKDDIGGIQQALEGV